MTAPPVTDLSYAYAAGLIDGEGCFSFVTDRDQRKCPRLYVSMMHEQTIRWMQNTFGGALNTEVNKLSRTMWRWSVGSRILRVHLPYLASHLITKHEQATLILELLELRSRYSARFGACDLDRQATIVQQVYACNGGKRGS